MEDFHKLREVIRWFLWCGDDPLYFDYKHLDSGDVFSLGLMNSKRTVLHLIGSTSTGAHYMYLRKALNERRHFDVLTHLINCRKFDPQYQDSDGNILHIACILFVSNIMAAKHVSTRSREADSMKVALTPRRGGVWPGDEAKIHEVGSKLKEIIEYAIEKCHCDPQIKNSKGALPLHIACCSEWVPLEVVQLLSKCDVNTGLGSSWEFDYCYENTGLTSMKLVRGDTPLHIACLRNSIEIVKYLTEECHCDPQIQNCQGVLPLHFACSNGSLEIVKLVSHCNANTTITSTCTWILRNVKEPTVHVVEGDTPLHIACRYKEDVIVKYLIEECHCDPQIQNCQGVLPLHIACSGGSLEMVKLVSHRNTNTAITSTISRDKKEPTVHVVEGDTPLHIACRYKEDVIVKYLIEECHCDPQIQNCQGVLPLHIACSGGSLEMVKLVSHRNTNTAITSTISRDKKEPTVHVVEGDTPLHIACRCEEDVIVKYLSEECHCDPQIKNSEGALALHIACAVGSLSIVKLVSNCDVNSGLSSNWDFHIAKGATPLHIACLRNAKEIVKYLIEVCHCDPQIVDCNGVLPLHFACANGSLGMVRLVSNCDVTAAVKSSNTYCNGMFITAGHTPFQIITKFWNKHKEREGIMMFLLKEKRCKVWLPQDRDNVIVRYLNEVGYHAVVYLKYIASYLRDKQDENGNTILHIACRPCVDVSQSLLIVKCLIEGKYCSPCVLNSEGELPLHVACSQQSLEIVKLVSNCDVTRKTITTGDTPLHIACKNSTVKVVKYLIKQYHCDPTAINNSDETCLETAVMYGQPDVVKYLIDIMDLQHSYICKLLHCALIHERVEIMKCIVEMDLLDQSHQHERGGTIVNIPDDNGELPIHIACRQNSLDVVELVSNHTDDINATAQKSGDTPLHIACRNQTTRFVKYLTEEKQCNSNIPNNNGELPLHIACSEQANEIVKIVSDCDLNFPSKLGNTPLHGACGATKAFVFPNKSLEIVRYLVSHKKCKVNVRNNEGKTAIHYACKLQSVELVNCLLLNGKADLLLSDYEGQTPLMFATNPALIKVLLHHGADPRPLYKSFAQYFRGHSSENPPPTPQKILVVGNAGAGKTSLIQSLESEGQKIKGSNEPQPTAGIIPTNFQSDIYGPVIWYDFAGQKEYYASHEAILHNLIAFSSPVILLVVDISKNEANTRQHLLYWLAFISKCISARDKPHLIVIGSHADIAMKEGIDSNLKLQQVLKNVTKCFVSLRIKLVGRIPMDCRELRSSGIAELQECLKSSSSQLRTDTVVGFTCHCFYIFLLDRFYSKTAITIQQIIDAISEAATEEDTDEFDLAFSTDSESGSSLSSDDNELSSVIDYHENDIMKLLPDKIETIHQFCEDLNDRGHIILVKDLHQYEQSWVILNKEEILTSVNGTVFAPMEFTEHRIEASSTGVVPLSKFVTHFPNSHPDMLTGFLSHLEFYHEIKDREVLKLIYTEQNNLERYFFFPGLVSVTTPEGVWKPDDLFNYKCGFILHCSETDKFFTPRFLQVLILRLAFLFALVPCTHSVSPAIERLCCVWKNGISWINENGIESVVEVLEDIQTVVVMLRCISGEENEAQCIFHRSSVIQTVLSTKADICPHISTTEFFIHPSYVQYPLKVCDGITLFSLAAIARAVTNVTPFILSDCGKNRGQTLIKVEELLYFEPFSGCGKKVLQEMFEVDNCSKEVSDDFIDSIARRTKSAQKTKWLEKIFELQIQETDSQVPEGPTRDLIGLFQTWRQCTAGTYQCLRETLDKFSVFCGGNPLVS